MSPATTCTSCKRRMDPLNTIIHDESFTTTFGRQPATTDDDIIRIVTHLNYVLNLLYQNTPDTILSNPKLKHQRELNLQYLQQYIKSKQFPQSNHNHDVLIEKNLQ